MKVIGLTNGRYLLEASDSEIGKLFGNTDSEWLETKRQHMRPLYGDNRQSLVGLEINVDAAYAQLAWLRRRSAEFEDLVRKLQSTASAIQDSRPLFNFVTGNDGSKVA